MRIRNEMQTARRHTTPTQRTARHTAERRTDQTTRNTAKENRWRGRAGAAAKQIRRSSGLATGAATAQNTAGRSTAERMGTEAKENFLRNRCGMGGRTGVRAYVRTGVRAYGRVTAAATRATKRRRCGGREVVRTRGRDRAHETCRDVWCVCLCLDETRAVDIARASVELVFGGQSGLPFGHSGNGRFGHGLRQRYVIGCGRRRSEQCRVDADAQGV